MADQSRIQEITDRMEDGLRDLLDSDRYRAYLETMSRFHQYSARNTMLVHMQNPEASMLAGFGTWKHTFGRHVKKGEKGIRILAPAPFAVQKQMEKLDPDLGIPLLGTDGKPVIETVSLTIPQFKEVFVFDVSQTEGKPLPSLVEDLTDSVERYPALLEALEKASPLPVVFEALPDDTDGLCRYGRSIALREDMSQAQTISALVHETAHALLHDRNAAVDTQSKSLRTKELEAESVSYVVCRHFGIETAANSFGYLAEWGGEHGIDGLKASLEVRQLCAICCAGK